MRLAKAEAALAEATHDLAEAKKAKAAAAKTLAWVLVLFLPGLFVAASNTILFNLRLVY